MVVVVLPVAVPAINRAVTVDVATLPASNPTVYGVVFVHVTPTLPVWLITVANDDVVPKGTVLAVIVQFAKIVKDTTRLAVAVAEFASCGINKHVLNASATSTLDLIHITYFFTFDSDSKDTKDVDIEEE